MGDPEKTEGLSPELQTALQPWLAAIESVSERIAEYNQRIEDLAQQNYPQVALLKQIKGVGTLIALTFLLTLQDPHRFGKSRDVGGYLGLQPGRRKSGQSERSCISARKAIPTCAPYWCKARNTSWGRSAPTAICAAGD